MSEATIGTSSLSEEGEPARDQNRDLVPALDPMRPWVFDAQTVADWCFRWYMCRMVQWE